MDEFLNFPIEAKINELPYINLKFKRTVNRGALKSQSYRRAVLIGKALRRYTCFRLNNGNLKAIFIYIKEKQTWYWGIEYFGITPWDPENKNGGEVLKWMEFENTNFFKSIY